MFQEQFDSNIIVIKQKKVATITTKNKNKPINNYKIVESFWLWPMTP